MKAFGILGLVFVLLAILLLGPFVRNSIEGFSQANSTLTPSEVKEKVLKLGEQLIVLNKFMEDPLIDSSTKDKIVKEKEALQKEIETLSGTPLPSAEVQPLKKEGFTGTMSIALEKSTKGKDIVQSAIETPL